MADTSKIAKNLERFAQAVAAHDRENPTHTAYGIGLAHFDMERLGLDLFRTLVLIWKTWHTTPDGPPKNNLSLSAVRSLRDQAHGPVQRLSGVELDGRGSR